MDKEQEASNYSKIQSKFWTLIPRRPRSCDGIQHRLSSVGRHRIRRRLAIGGMLLRTNQQRRALRSGDLFSSSTIRSFCALCLELFLCSSISSWFLLLLLCLLRRRRWWWIGLRFRHQLLRRCCWIFRLRPSPSWFVLRFPFRLIFHQR